MLRTSVTFVVAYLLAYYFMAFVFWKFLGPSTRMVVNGAFAFPFGYVGIDDPMWMVPLNAAFALAIFWLIALLTRRERPLAGGDG